MSNLAQAANYLAELGYAVFPCIPGTKRPQCEHGCSEATTDAETIDAWWTKWPDANIGLSTNGLLVIDVDVDGGGNSNPWLADQPDKLLDLAAGPMSITPRGGRHYIFRQPGTGGLRNTAGTQRRGLAPNVDTRADGGYIVVPPSVLAGDKRYRWGGEQLDIGPEKLPQPPFWLLRALCDPAGRLESKRSDSASPSNKIPAGQRNAALTSLAGAMRRVGMSAEEIAAALHKANSDRCIPPLAADEVAVIANSVARYDPDNLSVALVEHWADQDKESDYDNPDPSRADPGPFPAELLKVPGFLGLLTQHSLRTAHSPQPVLALGAALPLLGTLAGRKVRDTYDTRTNIYTLGVCDSGGGKERARLVNKETLYLSGQSKLIGPEGFASHSGILTAVAAQPSILFQFDEIGRLLRTSGDFRSPHLYHVPTVLMKLFSSSNSVYHGDAYADSERNITIDQPNACLYGTTVPRSFYEGLTLESVTDGFLSRLLIFETNDSYPETQKVPVAELPKAIVEIARFWADYRPGGNLAGEHPKPAIVGYTPDSEAIFDELQKVARRELTGTKAPHRTLWTRTVEKARKLALLFACSEYHEAPVIDSEAAEWACRLSDYLTRRLIFVAHHWITESAFEARRQRVLRVIKDRPGLTATQLLRATRSLANRERDEVLDALKLAGEIRIETQESAGGRPKSCYFPNS